MHARYHDAEHPQLGKQNGYRTAVIWGDFGPAAKRCSKLMPIGLGLAGSRH